MLNLQNICVDYGKGDNAVHALKSTNLTVNNGDFLAVTGKSGCGKSTLLNIIGGIRKPTSGTYYFNNRDINKYNSNKLSEFRNKEIGFVVQHFALIQDMTVSQNIALPLKYRNCSRAEINKKVEELIEKFELKSKENRFPSELSGGQKQRVAIARAIIGTPSLLLADEPTGALDEETGRKIIDIFKSLNSNGMTVIIVTHDPEIAAICKKRITMKDGKILN